MKGTTVAKTPEGGLMDPFYIANCSNSVGERNNTPNAKAENLKYLCF
jgi:hypothetical protein